MTPKRLLPAFSLLWVLFSASLSGQPADSAEWQAEAMEPSSANPDYWEYKGSPTYLLGGSWQDNPFNHPTNLEEWLDILQAVGGNYLRNTMSHRNEGNEFAFARISGGPHDGVYDLDQWNDTYWERLDDFLRLCYERDIIVQIEIWATWDHHELHQSYGGWNKHPFNPANNVTYTSSSTGLPTTWSSAPTTGVSGHRFFNNTVPALSDVRGATVLPYREAFVDKLLSISLQYPNVLYCMNNETGEELEG